MRKFFYRGPIQSIEVAKTHKVFDLGILIERGGYEQSEVILHFGLLFWNVWLKPRIKIHTTKVVKEGERTRYFDKQRTFGILLSSDGIRFGYGKAGDWKEGRTTTTLYFSSLLDKLFGRAKYWNNEAELEERKGAMSIQSYKNPEQLSIINFTYKHVTRYAKRWLFPTKVWQTTSVDCDPVEMPGKGTTSYNCGDDAMLGFSCPGHLSLADIKKKIAGDAYYYRDHYPL